LVDPGLCSRVSISNHCFHDNGLFIIYAFPTTEISHSDVEVKKKKYEKRKEENKIVNRKENKCN